MQPERGKNANLVVNKQFSEIFVAGTGVAIKVAEVTEMKFRIIRKIVTALLSLALLTLLSVSAFGQGKKDDKQPKEPAKIKVEPKKDKKPDDRKPQEGGGKKKG